MTNGMLAKNHDGTLQLWNKAIVASSVSESIEGDFAGAIVTFTGLVRRQSQGRIVRHLEYEAYPEMVITQMNVIQCEVKKKWPGAKVAIFHRVGSLKIGEIAVVIAVGTPHRQEAFQACSHSIERLKEIVPIWKKEIFTDGTTWIGWGS